MGAAGTSGFDVTTIKLSSCGRRLSCAPPSLLFLLFSSLKAPSPFSTPSAERCATVFLSPLSRTPITNSLMLLSPSGPRPRRPPWMGYLLTGTSIPRTPKTTLPPYLETNVAGLPAHSHIVNLLTLTTSPPSPPDPAARTVQGLRADWPCVLATCCVRYTCIVSDPRE